MRCPAVTLVQGFGNTQSFFCQLYALLLFQGVSERPNEKLVNTDQCPQRNSR